MKNETELHSGRFDDATVRDVLKCAIELDELRASSLSFAQLQHVASEIGISDAALSVAIDQVSSKRRSLLTRASRTIAEVAKRWFTLGAAGAGATSVLYALGDPGDPTPFGPVLVTLLLTVAARAILAPQKGAHRIFQAGNAGLWAGVAAVQAVAVLYGNGSVALLTGMVLIPMGVVWLASSCLGSVIIGFRRLVERNSQNRNGVALSWLLQRSKARLKVALIGWIDQTLRVLVPIEAEVQPQSRRGRCSEFTFV